MDNNQLPQRQELKDIRFEEPTFIDPLTGLFNQYYLYEFLPEEIKKAKLGNYSLAISMIDLDGFKNINDTYGHLCGDEILRQLATIIKKSVRQTDMVIRYAGDEFAILLPAAGIDRTRILSNKLVEDVDKNVFKGNENQDIHLTISVGFSVYPNDSEIIDKLIDLADKALYLSKQKGKNRVSHAKEVTLEAVSHVIAMDSFPCLRFIDRKEEIDRLKHVFDTFVVKSSLLQVAFISGEAGIGKTRLLSELNNYVQDRAVIISCHSTFANKQHPYYLFAKGISTYIDKIGIGSPQILSLFSQLPSAELAELSLLIPSIASLVNKPAVLGPEDKKTRFLLFKSFLDFLIELNKTSEVLISFDDIHWADKASLELLRYLSKQEKNKRIFIVCSFVEDKSKQITDDTDLKGLWEDIRFNDNFTQLKLKDFSFEDTVRMVEVIFPGIEAGKEFYEMIYQAAKGNPSFVEELLKSLIENAIIFYQDNHWQIKKDLSNKDIPLSLDEVIKKRLRNLDEETKEMIVQAAVIGEDFSIDILKKIGDKDEGFMLELLNRAKKMRLVDELEEKGSFGFINKDVQNILYNELNDEQRNRIHYKISQALAEGHKDYLYNVAGELAFHLGKAPPQEDKVSEYNRTLLERTEQIFSPSEIIGYLDRLAKEVIVEKEKVVQPLSDKMFKEAIRLVKSLQGAVKGFHLYPPGVMRDNSLKEILSVLNIIWEEAECISLAEVERGLLINGKRISHKEIEQANAEYFLSLLVEQNIKTISFMKGMLQDELDKFIQYLSQSPEEITGKSGWAGIIKKEGIKGIKVDEVRFIQVGGFTKEFEEKKKIEDIMLMEFLLGKVGGGSIDKKAFIHNMEKEPKKFAQTIMETAKEVLKEGKVGDEVKAVTDSIEKINSQILQQEPQDYSDYAKNLANVILELEPTLRNKVIRSQVMGAEPKYKEVVDSIVKATPDEVIIDMILEEYKDSQGNLLVTKDALDKTLLDDSRRIEILSKLEAALLKLDVVEQDVDFIKGEIEWEDLPLDKWINNLIKLPDKYYKPELGKIKALLEELDSKQKKKEVDIQKLDSTIYQLILKSEEGDPQINKDLKSVVVDFIKAPFLVDKVDALGTASRVDGLLRRLDIETDPKVFTDLLGIFKEIIKDFVIKLEPAENIFLEIEKPTIKRYCQFLYQIIGSLSKRFEWEKNRNPQIYKIIGDFIKEVSYGNFLEILIYTFINSSSREKPDLKSFFDIIGDSVADTLINLQTKERITWGDSFREYVMKKGIIDLLKELGESALNRLKLRLSQMSENIPPSLIELIGHLKNEDLIDVIAPFVYHKDPFIRRTTLMALNDIGGEKTIGIIQHSLKKEKDKKIRILAKRNLRKLKLRENKEK